MRSCERLEGSSTLKREAADFVMEITISDDVMVSAAPAASTAPERREAVEGTTGVHNVAGPSEQIETDRVQISNLICDLSKDKESDGGA